jgi:hypothetical protein
MRQFCLVKMQVARQLLNYKKGRFMNTQVSILPNPSDLDERLREGVAMITPKFVSSTLLRICDPDPSSYGSNFSNLFAVMKSLPSTACMYIWLVADSTDNDCFCLLVDVVESWIHNMSRFAAAQTIDECTAKSMDLPTSLVERRKRRAPVYYSREYLDFVCFVESTYLANLTLKMMMAYNDGDIISKIKLGILSHDDSRDRFSCLSGSDNEDDNRHLLAYIMERYANMQGTYL